eukprot:768137-Hanusia_phi.AAC.13
MMYSTRAKAGYCLVFALGKHEPVSISCSLTAFQGLIMLPHTSPSSFEFKVSKFMTDWSGKFHRPSSLRGGMAKSRAKKPPAKEPKSINSTDEIVDLAHADFDTVQDPTENASALRWEVQKVRFPCFPFMFSSGTEEQLIEWFGQAGDLEVLSTRESVLKRPDMWIGDVTTVIKNAWEVVFEDEIVNEDNDNVTVPTYALGSPLKTPVKSLNLNHSLSYQILHSKEDLTSPLSQQGSASNQSISSPVQNRSPRKAPIDPGRMGGRTLIARQREMKYNAGVLKTFDEIIVNAVDRQVCDKKYHPRFLRESNQVEVEEMREIRVNIDAATGKITVWNDGPGIEPVMHKSGKGLIPEVAFGEFMASTNFDDNTRQRFTGGRFGVGAKATNAWSKLFTVNTFHAKSGVEYEQITLNDEVLPFRTLQHYTRAIRQQKRDKLKLDDSKTGLAKMKNYFRQHMAIIVVALLPNPRFDGQTKEKLTLNPREWGFPATIDERLVERIDRHLGLVDKVLMEAEARNLAALSRKAGVAPGASARVSIAKYQGANMAGKVEKIAVQMRFFSSIFEDRGRLCKRSCSGWNGDCRTRLLWSDTSTVLGLQFGVEYTPENVHRLLRYDHFVIFCDQDPDGAHIAGELINYFTIMFPSLLKAKPDFLMRLGTPIIRLKSRSGMSDHDLRTKYKVFLNIWNVPCYKRIILRKQNLDDHLVPILYRDQEDDEVVDKWFRKNRADARKVMYTAIKKKFKDPIKVVQFAGAVLETAAYHHGDAALQQSREQLLQWHAVSAVRTTSTFFIQTDSLVHDIPTTLEQQGQNQFVISTLRLSSIRYISAGLEKITRAIFRPEDDPILVGNIFIFTVHVKLFQEYQNEDGQMIEPKYFLPVVPMALINGCEAGIAVGWSSFVPMYNPRDILAWLRERLKHCRDQDPEYYSIEAPIPGVLDAALSQTREDAENLERMNDNEGPTDPVETRADDVSVEEEGDENQMTDADIPSTSSKVSTSVRASMKHDGFTDVLVPWYDGFEGEVTEKCSCPERHLLFAKVVRTGPHSFKLRGKAEYFEPLKKGAHGTVVVTEIGPTVRSDALREAWKERWGPAEIVNQDAKRKKAMEAHQFLKDEQIHNTATKVHIELFVDPQKIRAAAGVSNPKKHLTLEKLEKILGISESGMAMRRFATPGKKISEAATLTFFKDAGALLHDGARRRIVACEENSSAGEETRRLTLRSDEGGREKKTSPMRISPNFFPSPNGDQVWWDERSVG